MRISPAAIRGVRPATRFAAPATNRREQHLGLLRTTQARLAASPARAAHSTALAAIRAAARGQLGTAEPRPGASHGIGPLGALRRPDAINWPQAANSVQHRARPRSAAPWRG